jgi:hypothetical protein
MIIILAGQNLRTENKWQKDIVSKKPFLIEQSEFGDDIMYQCSPVEKKSDN